MLGHPGAVGMAQIEMMGKIWVNDGAKQLRNGAEGMGSRNKVKNFLGRDEAPGKGSREDKCFLCWHSYSLILGLK